MGSTSSCCLPRSNGFPASLRVLVVDNDVASLKALEKLLNKCNYEVKTCNSGEDALRFLEENQIDIVMSEAQMSDMDGFKFLEHVSLLKTDVPMIMMSAKGEADRVMKAIQNGACDYLVKPIRKKEVGKIWQHVYRRKMQELKGCREEDEIIPDGSEVSTNSGKKRKENHNLSNDQERGDSGSSVKKARVVWNSELHDKFVQAVNQIGLDKVGPKRILDLMGVPWLTRENVASHLQKFRLYQSKAEKEKVASAYGGLHQNMNNNSTITLPTADHNIQPTADHNIQPMMHGGGSFNPYFHLLNNSNSKMQPPPPQHMTWPPLNSHRYPNAPQGHPFQLRDNSEPNIINNRSGFGFGTGSAGNDAPQGHLQLRDNSEPNIINNRSGFGFGNDAPQGHTLQLRDNSEPNIINNRSGFGFGLGSAGNVELNCYSQTPPPGEFYPVQQKVFGYKNQMIGEIGFQTYDSA